MCLTLFLTVDRFTDSLVIVNLCSPVHRMQVSHLCILLFKLCSANKDHFLLDKPQLRTRTNLIRIEGFRRLKVVKEAFPLRQQGQSTRLYRPLVQQHSFLLVPASLPLSITPNYQVSPLILGVRVIFVNNKTVA